MSSTLEQELADITKALNEPTIEPRLLQQTVLRAVGPSSTADVVFWLAYLAVLCGLLVLAVRRKQV